ncbi:MAG: 3-carboxy-cis,cis-muconate cycloisomerase [Pseudonocardiales bacterium]|nr:3-carboxy-cis,cis-muconate cycloisomerase [Pseudonocardiales bacterium]
MSGLWEPIFGRSTIAATTSDRAWVIAMCDAEAALGTACAESGLLDAASAQRITDACRQVAETADPAELGRHAAADGNPVIPLVRAIRSVVGATSAASVHLGATSQDILDTAAMLVVRRALPVILESMNAAAEACAVLAREHRDTVMIGRTLLQQAVPTTFGAVAAGWGEGLDRTTLGLRAALGGLAVQLGGAAGTLGGWHPHGPAVRAAFAAELGLADPGTVWHTERSRIAELGSALGATCGVVGKIATDVVLLAQTELGEVREAASGGSSSMAHKHNPIAAVTARAGAAQAPGVFATLLAAMPAELQRAAGPWHAEWPALTALLDTTGGCTDRLATSLAGLEVDTGAMARNVPRDNIDVGHAGDLVDHYLAGRS